MKKRIYKTTSGIIICGLLTTLPTFINSEEVYAKGNLESEFLSLLNKYKIEDVIVENGISISKSETVDLSKYTDWEMSNDDTVSIDKNGILHPINEGTVYISKEIKDKIYILEVYVSDNIETYSLEPKSTTVDRNYYKVFVDAGHGGSDPGAIGNGNYEDEINLSIAKKVESKLKEKGIDVKMSRTEDVYLALQERTKMANEYGADVFVSIHQNSFSDSNSSGLETYYHTNKAEQKSFSSDIQDSSIRETGAKNRGVKSANFAVLRESAMVSSLIEGGFITNPQESAKLVDPVYQEKLANGIVNGIEKYLKENIILTENPTTPPETTPTPTPTPTPNPEPTPPPTTTIKVGTVTATSLNVRSGYGTSYSKIGSLSKGTKVEIVESKNGWYKIKYNTGYGYVSGDYISISGSSSGGTVTPPSTTTVKTGTVTATSLNVRSGYGTSYSKIGSLSKGAKVEIVESKNGWYKIKYNTGYGYISGEYISISGSSSGGTVTPTPPTTVKTGTVTATSLNVRSGYGTSYSKIGSLSKGAKVEIVESKNGWHKIKYNTGYGYISGEYISISGSSNGGTVTPTPPTTVKTGTVTTTSLNVRSGYGTSYSKIGSLSKGAKVEIVESKNGWYKIKYKTGYGYVSADYIKL